MTRREGSIARANSSADISSYGCGEASRVLQILASIILLVASLVMIGTGNHLYSLKKIFFFAFVLHELHMQSPLNSLFLFLSFSHSLSLSLSLSHFSLSFSLSLSPFLYLPFSPSLS